MLQPIHGFEARADAGDLRDGKETEVMVARKHDSPPVPHPAQNQAEESLELIGIPAVLLSVQLYQWIERSEVWLSDSVHRAWTMTNQRTEILFLSHFLEIQNNGRRDSLRLRASDSLRRCLANMTFDTSILTSQRHQLEISSGLVLHMSLAVQRRLRSTRPSAI